MTIRHYHTRFECFATEQEAEQWAASYEMEGWTVLQFCRDRLADVLDMAKPWSVTVQAPSPYAVARGVAA